MTSRGRGAGKVDLDRQEWVNDVRDGARRSERRTQERRRGEAATPAQERRRSAERRAGAGSSTGEPGAGRVRGKARGSTRRTTAVLAIPGVSERRAVVLITFLLMLYGLVMAYSASSAQSYFTYHTSFYFAERQLAWALVGVIVMWVLARVDYAWWRRLALPLAGLAAFVLAAVLVPGVGARINGARRWIMIGGQGIQPSEFAKLAAVILVAALIARRPREIESPKGFLGLAAIGILPAAGLVMLEPDLGTTVVLVVAVVAVLVAAGTPLRYLFGLFAGGAACVLGLIVVEPYRLQRLTTFLDPWKDPQGSGFQATQSLISIASGHIFGVGLGNSIQKFGYLPAQGTDMITGIIGEELGLVGLIVLLVLYGALAWAGLRIAINCKELFGKLLATGITAIIVGQACINIGAALGVLPLTGVPLPLVSLGGTSVVAVLGGLGILLNIATNRRSYIVVSAQRGDGSDRGGRHRRSSAAGARRRG